MRERCPKEHTLELYAPDEITAAHAGIEKYAADARFACSLCAQVERRHMYHCAECQYEICPNCFATPSSSVDEWGRPKKTGWALPRFLRPRPPKGHETPQFWEGIYSLNWLHIAMLTIPPLVGFWGLFVVPLTKLTAVWFGLNYAFGSFGITAGYHRLFAHCAYSASKTVQWFLALGGAAAMQGSALWWARNHRAHHRYCDSDKDPYNARRGLWFSHIGWMVMNQNYGAVGRVDFSDLKDNPILQFQHKYYPYLALGLGVYMPILVAGLCWGDWWGGLVYSCMLKIWFIHHGTFFINSLAHFQLPEIFGGGQTYSDRHSTADNWLVAMITNGEGYHNFHHEFPQDYRNGVRMWQWDPTKWFVRLCSCWGGTYDLIRFPGSEIEKGRLQQRWRIHTSKGLVLLKALSKFDHGPAEETLPGVTMEEVQRQAAEGKKLCVINGIVYDYARAIQIGTGVTHGNKTISWYDAHPGGKKYLDAYLGKDATDAFQGGIYRHSHAAENLLNQLAVYRLQDDH